MNKPDDNEDNNNKGSDEDNNNKGKVLEGNKHVDGDFIVEEKNDDQDVQVEGVGDERDHVLPHATAHVAAHDPIHAPAHDPGHGPAHGAGQVPGYVREGVFKRKVDRKVIVDVDGLGLDR